MNQPQPGRAGFLRNFFVSAAGTSVSRVLGAVRDIFIAGYLGAGTGSDAFWIAFTVPNVLRRFVADEGLTGILVPAVAQAEDQDGTPRAHSLANSLFTALMLANLLICTLGILFPEPLVNAFAYSFQADPAKFALTVQLTRWLFPFVAMVSMVSFAEGLLNHRGHFFTPKIAPGIVSMGIVIAILLTGDWIQPREFALVLGVLVGGAVHVLINIPPLLRHWGRIRLSFNFRLPRFRRAAAEMSKVLLIGVLAQTQILVLRQLAASLGDGGVTRFWYGNRIVDVAQGVVAVAIGSALLPAASKAFAAKDWDGFRADFKYSLRLAAFFLLPTAAVLASFALPITAILFRHGRFVWEDVQLTVGALTALTPFLLFISIVSISRKAYYAIDERNSILVIGLLGVCLTLGMGLWLIGIYDIVGLGIAFSFSTMVQAIAYLYLLNRRVDGGLKFGTMVKPLLKIILCCVPVAAALWWIQTLGQWEQGPSRFANFVVLGGGLLLSGSIYLTLAWLLKVDEMQAMIRMVRRKIGKSKG